MTDATCVHVKDVMQFVHSTFKLQDKWVHHHPNAIIENSVARRNAIALELEDFGKYPMWLPQRKAKSILQCLSSCILHSVKKRVLPFLILHHLITALSEFEPSRTNVGTRMIY